MLHYYLLSLIIREPCSQRRVRAKIVKRPSTSSTSSTSTQTTPASPATSGGAS